MTSLPPLPGRSVGLLAAFGSSFILRGRIAVALCDLICDRALDRCDGCPASTWYLLMTLGPAIALIPYAEKTSGWLARILVTIGRVPLFYYLLHIPLIHLSALLVNFIKNGSVAPEWYVTAPFSSVPPEYTWSLGLLYGVFLIDVVILYVASRWYGSYKRAHPEKGWLKYL